LAGVNFLVGLPLRGVISCNIVSPDPHYVRDSNP
jgi:hypothetical protein